jgi:hypothetical protein
MVSDFYVLTKQFEMKIYTWTQWNYLCDDIRKVFEDVIGPKVREYELEVSP